jgi:hypothetical protein
MTQHDITKWSIDDVYGQCTHVHSLTIRITFVTTFCFNNYFYNYRLFAHYLPHVLNWGYFKTMIANVEKIQAIKFQ